MRAIICVIKKVPQHITVTKAETFDPVVELGEAQEDQDRCPDMCVAAQPPQHIVTIRIARTQIQQNDIVIEAADLQTVQTEIRGVADKLLLDQHRLDAGWSRSILPNKKHAHNILQILGKGRQCHLRSPGLSEQIIQ